MPNDSRNVVVLGATGSVGISTLEVIEASGGKLQLFAMSAHRRLADAAEQCQLFRPKYLVATDPVCAADFDRSLLPPDTELLIGQDSVEDVVTRAEVHTVVSAIVGSAGLRGSWAAAKAGKRVALANKETMVVAGPLIMSLARENDAEIIPVDSEHSAIFQAMEAGNREDLDRIVLTASGGPFREYTLEQMKSVTLEQALKHPTYEMGPKITIDSATMLNKALEVIEAKWLFDLSVDQIEVVIHPQSIIHSMVEFQDGSVIAQLSPPDMKLPIQYALTYPERTVATSRRMDWTQPYALTFDPPDLERFPALNLGREVAERGGTTGAVLNAAKEQAVQKFINSELAFHQIVSVCREVLDHHTFDPTPSLEQLMAADAWAREEVKRWTTAS